MSGYWVMMKHLCRWEVGKVIKTRGSQLTGKSEERENFSREEQKEGPLNDRK